MRKIKFKRIGAVNFCCFKDKIELVFEEGKVVLITGPNGAGKTTMFDIIPYTFYGVTSKGLRGDDVVNDEVEKNCHTWVDFEIDNDNYFMEKYCKDSKFGNTVLLQRNGVIIKKGHSEVLPEIERLLVPQKLFMNTLLFSQKVKTFFTDLSDADQKDIFRKVLLLDDFVIWYNECNIILKELEQTQTNIESEISLKIGLFESIIKDIINVKSQRELFYKRKEEDILNFRNTATSYQISIKEKKNVLEKEESLNDLLKKAEDIKEKYGNLNAQLSNLDSSLTSSIRDIKNQKTVKEKDFRAMASEEENNISREKSEISSTVEKEFNAIDRNLEKKKSEFEKEISVLEYSLTSSLKELKSKHDSLKKYESSLSGETSVCPLCKQKVSNSIAEEFKKHQKEMENEILELTIFIKGFQERIPFLKSENKLVVLSIKENESAKSSKLFNQLAPLEKKEKDIIQRLKVALEKLINLEKELEESARKKVSEEKKTFENEIKSLTSTESLLKDKIKELSTIMSDISKLERDIEVVNSLLSQKEKEEYDDSLLNTLLTKKEDIITSLKDNEDKKKVADEEVKIIDFWKEGFSTSGIPSMLIDEAIPFMNERISYYLDKIGGRYVVSFDTQAETKAGDFRDKVAVRILDTKTKANSRKKLSGGQTRVVDITTILTLCDLQNRIQDMTFNIMLFDEIFDSLDDENIGYISNLLRSLLEGKSIYIISHCQIDQIEADNVLKFY